MNNSAEVAKPLRFLYLEDDKNDIDLVQAKLEEEGFTFNLTSVETQTEFISAIEEDRFDIILSDYRLPLFDGISALVIAQERLPKVPFIFLTGRMGEELVIECLKMGATDYVLKHRLSRLGPVVRRALKEAEWQLERTRTEEASRESEERYRQIVELSPDAIYIQSGGSFVFVNKAGIKLFGASTADQILGRKVLDLMHSDYREIVRERIRQLREDGTPAPLLKEKYLRLDGSSVDVEVAAIPTTYHGRHAAQVMVRDITKRRQAEATIERLRHKNDLILNSAGEGIIGLDADTMHTFVNPAAARMLGYEGEELLGKKSHAVWHHTRSNGSSYPKRNCPVCISLKDGCVHRESKDVFWRKDGTSFPVVYTSSPIIEQGRTTGTVVTFRDITGQKRAEEEREALNIISHLFLAHEDIEDIYSELPWVLSERFHFPIVNVEVYDRESNLMRLAGSLGSVSSPEQGDMLIPVEDTISGEVAVTGEFIISAQADKLPQQRLGLLSDLGIKTILTMPIKSKRRILGTLTLADTRERENLTLFVKTLQVVSNHLATELERVRIWEALRRAKKEWEHTFDAVPDLISILDKEFRIVRINLPMAQKLGLNPADCIGKTCYELVHGAASPPVFCPHARLIGDGTEHIAEVHEERLGGHFIVTTSPIYDENGDLIGGVHMARDITERKRAEDQIKSALHEKETLLREIHHRVKNNMQIISSLLRLRGDYIKDETVLDVFQESQNRIRSMALIHEKLYQSIDLSRINFRDYLLSLTSELYRIYGIDSDRITLSLNSEEVYFAIDVAIPCGLIFNELITNSLKHAFPEQTKGEISVAMDCSHENEVRITIRDSGIGIPEAIDPSSSETLGLYLVRMLVEDQLNGSIAVSSAEGTEIMIRFKT